MNRPNILFIVADDLNSWIEPLGRHPQVKTPNISRLATMGTTFTRAYCTAPYCNASRMSVFTGCLPSTTGIYQNEPFWQQPLRRRTFIEHLRDSGYHCFGAGKVFHGNFDYASAGRTRSPSATWKDTQNRMELWDEFAGIDHEPMPPSRPLNRMFDFDRFDEVSPWNHLFDWGVLPPDREPEVPDHLSVTAVAEFLQRTHAEPFFCALGLYKPHLPWYAPQRFYDLYPIESVALPVVKEDDLEDVPQIAQKWARSPPDHETVIQHGQWRNAVQGYLASISYCDDFVGQTLDALQASPYADNTIVVLWGDNGFHLGEKLHWRKFVLWEEACRVPFIISMLGQRTPSRVDTPVSLVDLFPTLCALCDVGPMGNVDGVSLLDILNGAEVERGRPAEMIWGKGNRSIRSNQWRYTRYIDGSEELYDHNSDPSEWTNLARIDGFDSVLSAMRSSLSTNSRD